MRDLKLNGGVSRPQPFCTTVSPCRAANTSQKSCFGECCVRTRTFASDTDFFCAKLAAVDRQQGASDLGTRGRPPARCALPWAFRRCITLSSGWHNCSNAEHALATLLHGASLFAITVAKRIAGAIYAYCPRQLDTFYLPSTCNVIHVMFRTRLSLRFLCWGVKGHT